jgi:uncharacterized protein
MDEASFEWDEIKRQTNLDKHGVDFIDAAYVFEQDYIFWEDDKQNYGEARYIALGLVDSVLLSVVFTIRENRYRIISARKAGRNDRRKYSSIYHGRSQSDESTR